MTSLARMTAIVLAIPFAAHTLPAQARPKAPVAKPAPVYSFPKIETRTLPNGLVVHIVENHALPLVAVRAVIEGGSLLDPAGKEGLYSLDLSLLRDGTTSMNGDQLAHAIEQLGAAVTPTSFTAITDEFEQALTLMGEMLMHPTFPADAVEQRKAATISALQRAEGLPVTAANRILNIILYGADHPFGRASTPASVASIMRDDIVRFHDAAIRPQNFTLVIVGDVTPESVMPLVTRVFGGWEKTGERTAVKVPSQIPSQPTVVYLFDRPGAPQTTVRIGQVGPTRSNPDYVALDLATQILGGPTGSRLSKSLREEHALTYGVTHVTQWRGWDEPSAIVGQSQVDAARTDSALIVWMDELKAITGARPVTDKEMEFGRAVTVGNMATRFETFDQIADQVRDLARFHLGMTFINDYVKVVNVMPAAAVSKIAARYINPTHTAVVVVGDRKTIELPLRAANIGPVLIVDAQGKPQ
jgi:zinc protease